MRSLSLPNDTLNHCYASDLEPEIAAWRPALWVHGHIHAAGDYTIAAGQILADPLGRVNENSGFRADSIVSLNATETAA